MTSLNLQGKFIMKNVNSKKEIFNQIDGFPKSNGKVVAYAHNITLLFKTGSSKQEKLVLRDASFDLHEGEILSIVGESGSGKTVITSLLLGLVNNKTKIIRDGKLNVDGVDVTNFSEKDWFKSKLLGSTISSVFQNPMTTLNPTMKIGKQIAETALVNNVVKTKKEAHKMALEMLKEVKMPNPENVMDMYPHEMSGGMKQRAVIAAVFIVKPKILILDEPTTALDPTIQAQIIKLIKELQEKNKTSIIFITHDIGVVASISDRILVMYAGKIVEFGKWNEILWNSKHPYTWGLIASMPDINKSKRLYTIPGSVPGILNNIKGDAFAPRNEYGLHKDLNEDPPYFQISSTHYVSSWLYTKEAPSFSPPEAIQERAQIFQKMKGAP